MKEKISGADALLQSLICEGVDLVFGYPGGSIIPVYDRLYDYQDQIKHVLVRHEQGATHAAQGYARVTGRPGVVIVTSGPAATNVITGLSDALMDSTPLVVITGQVATPFLGFDAFQETDVVGITQPITKWSYQIRRPEDVAPAVARAFYIASTGRPGPVVLDFAKDAQVGLTEFNYKKCDYIRSYIPYPEIDDTDLQRAANIINASERPMILSGHGVMIANAEKELAEFAEKGDIPVAATLLGLSTMPSSHRLYKGMLGMHGNIGPNINTNRADAIIAIGMRFDDRITGNVKTYAPNAKIIHIDIDSSEFDKNIATTATVHGDAREVLKKLIPLIEPKKRTEWLGTFEQPEKVELEKVIEPAIHPTGERMTMGEVVNRVSEATGHNAIVVTDVGQNQMLSARYFKYTEPRSILTSGGLGTMGFGLPAAIGAKMGAPDRTVCFFTGDGGLQMTIQELGTILEYHTDVKIILLNNNFLGNVRQWQALFFNDRFSQTPLVNPDFVMIAKAYGLGAEEVKCREELDGAIERMLNHDGAYLINVNIDEHDMIFPMTPAGSNVDHIMLNASECYPTE
ncbi:biosynthetic-type acetolactate synthase large subunit [Muribaculum sp. NM65_B17]|jgi:acetolactate synthase-1/2/3 large subunit|uniref:biosynthetic-type acetolactate synthase large subunit n=6 Tax=Muribaculum TaxID=1918540 RepID=UPI000F4970CD|nr:biosynthetic-type acetolactate synthase large subunit [Muribaculum sp. NM65_B17]ROT11986.1 biosynthetic-type acetolactate synthase large subunit [Muribaculaceae bacterium Isolate-102 (HZI)]TGY01848.1 biosynthetic-type acetolactate synthase large subunit [Muribaculum sp. NM65_B17]THG40030.1 biosynthetic-type acetolactate synthase large subunit [Muribaculaceae bacterium]